MAWGRRSASGCSPRLRAGEGGVPRGRRRPAGVNGSRLKIAAGFGVAMGEDKPEFGFGVAGRPLWTVRDRDAEAIRTVLRTVDRREFGARQDGFVVEGDGAPCVMALHSGPRDEPQGSFERRCEFDL